MELNYPLNFMKYFLRPGGFDIVRQPHIDILHVLPHLEDGLLVLSAGGVLDPTPPATEVSGGQVADTEVT